MTIQAVPVPPRSTRRFTAATALSAGALALSGTFVAVLIMRPAWVSAQVSETIFMVSVAVVPTLLFGAVLSLIRPSLRAPLMRPSPRAPSATHLGSLHLGTLLIGALAVAALGFVLLAAAGFSWASAIQEADAAYTFGAGDAGDIGQQPSLFTTLFPYLGISSLLLIWTSLTIVGLLLGPPVSRPVRRVVAVASTSLALTLTMMACIPNPIAQVSIATAVLAIVVVLARAERVAGRNLTRRNKPAAI